MSETWALPSSAEPDTPDWWVARLMPRLAAQAQRAGVLDSYYRNEYVLPPMCKAVRDAYRRLMEMARTNFAELIVEAVRERMQVEGFRTGADSDPLGDEAAWALWQDNALDADADLVHRAKLSMGAAYVIVGLDDAGDVVITPEDPRQVITEADPVRRRKVRAALKVFADDLYGLDRLYLYLPGAVYRATRPSPATSEFEDQTVALSEGGWMWETTVGIVPGGDVPVVPFLNRPDLYNSPQGEFESHVGHLERISYMVLNRLEVATLQAFRQRAVKGVPNTDEHGEPIDYDDIFAADPGALWVLPETADLWESGQVDLSSALAAVRTDVEMLAAVTRTPMHYLVPTEANQSAEGASLSHEALIYKVRDQLRATGESWEQVMALGFAFAGDAERASRADMEIIWADPERHSLAERADAALKAASAGMPWQAAMERIWQMTPQEIARLDAMRLSDALTAALAAPTPPGAPAAPSTPPGAPGGR